MEITVLIEPVANNGYRAKTGEPLPLTADGTTREEALRKLRELLNQRLRHGSELISVDLQADPADNPWLAMAGMYDPNDPLVQDWLREVERYREEVDQDPNYL